MAESHNWNAYARVGAAAVAVFVLLLVLGTAARGQDPQAQPSVPAASTPAPEATTPPYGTPPRGYWRHHGHDRGGGFGVPPSGSVPAPSSGGGLS
jgi:hypothetical protein